LLTHCSAGCTASVGMATAPASLPAGPAGLPTRVARLRLMHREGTASQRMRLEPLHGCLGAWLSGLATHPQPVARPGARSGMLWTLSTTPYGTQSWRRSSSVAVDARVPRKICTECSLGERRHTIARSSAQYAGAQGRSDTQKHRRRRSSRTPQKAYDPKGLGRLIYSKNTDMARGMDRVAGVRHRASKASQSSYRPPVCKILRGAYWPKQHGIWSTLQAPPTRAA